MYCILHFVLDSVNVISFVQFIINSDYNMLSSFCHKKESELEYRMLKKYVYKIGTYLTEST